MVIRERQAVDLSACVAALAAVHAVNRYPMRWPDDPAAWLKPHGMLAAWVAQDTTTGAILGHVALCAVSDENDAQRWRVASGSPAPAVGLAEVSRLFVALEARGQGLGAQLLAAARQEAQRRQLRPVLKVSSHDQHAIALYERQGWRRVASVSMPWSVTDPSDALLHYYLGPEFQ